MSRRPHGLACPHCDGPLAKRSSRSLTPTCQQVTLQCVDPDCGATYGAQFAITHGISPSARPRAGVALRMEEPRKRPANDAAPPPANDTGNRGPGVPRPANDDEVPGAATG